MSALRRVVRTVFRVSSTTLRTPDTESVAQDGGSRNLASLPAAGKADNVELSPWARESQYSDE